MSVTANFVSSLAEALKAVGLKAEARYETLTVADCRFPEPEARRSGERHVVTFLKSNFTVEKGGEFDVGRALGLVVQELPKLLKEKVDAERYRAAATAVRSVCQGKPREMRDYRSEYERDGAFLTPTYRGIEVTFICSTMEEAEELIRRAKGVQLPPSEPLSLEAMKQSAMECGEIAKEAS